MLRNYLAEYLPTYMIPTNFRKVKAIPLTTSGKVNRKLVSKIGVTLLREDEYEAPRTMAEQTLAIFWTELLHVDRVGRYDNFFELGGDSLQANQLVVKINQHFHTDLSVKTIFTAPTLSTLANVIESSGQVEHFAITPIERNDDYPTSSAQKRLYIMDQLIQNDISYNIPVTLTIEGALDRVRLEAAFQTLIQRHESLRTRFMLADGHIVQKVEEAGGFDLEYYTADDEDILGIIKGQTMIRKVNQMPANNSFSSLKLEKKERRRKGSGA
jgi:acyl carrier protein